ncbi:hypothetical protein KA531_01385 [Candidatus Saccharibacteria bacterium]|nr:hypothetical protein [Candidatus Saccharibacteria bacterium]
MKPFKLIRLRMQLGFVSLGYSGNQQKTELGKCNELTRTLDTMTSNPDNQKFESYLNLKEVS